MSTKERNGKGKASKRAANDSDQNEIACNPLKDAPIHGTCPSECLEMQSKESDEVIDFMLELIFSDPEICLPKAIAQSLSRFHVNNKETQRAALIGHMLGCLQRDVEDFLPQKVNRS